MALLFLFGSSCKEKNCLEARGRACGMSWSLSSLTHVAGRSSDRLTKEVL